MIKKSPMMRYQTLPDVIGKPNSTVTLLHCTRTKPRNRIKKLSSKYGGKKLKMVRVYGSPSTIILTLDFCENQETGDGDRGFIERRGEDEGEGKGNREGGGVVVGGKK